MMDEGRIRNLRYQVSEKMPLSYSDLLLLLDLANAQAAEIERLRQPKTLTVTVVSAYDRKPMNTFKIDPTKKTYVRPDHSMFGYVFEPEEQSE